MSSYTAKIVSDFLAATAPTEAELVDGLEDRARASSMAILEATAPAAAKRATVADSTIDADYMDKIPYELFIVVISPSRIAEKEGKSQAATVEPAASRNNRPPIPTLSVERQDVECLRLVSRKYHRWLHDIWMDMVERDQVRIVTLDHDFCATMAAPGESADWQSSMEQITLKLPESAFHYRKPDGAEDSAAGSNVSDSYGGFLSAKEAAQFQSALRYFSVSQGSRPLKLSLTSATRGTGGLDSKAGAGRRATSFLAQMQKSSVAVVKEDIMTFLSEEIVAGLDGTSHDEFAVHHFK